MASMNFDYELVPSPQQQQLSTRRRLRYHEDKSDADEAVRKNRYQPSVLVGDWYERRAKYVPPPDEWITVYEETYTCKLNEDLKKDRKGFQDNKTKAERGLGSEFLLEYPGETFHNNFTTTNDLFFRIFPRGLCGPQKRKYSSRRDLWLPQVDIAKNYGNLTEYGLMEAIKCENYLKSIPSPRETIQKRDFKRPKLSDITSIKRFPKPKGKMNEPFLCHLDIDPNLPFRPHLIKMKT